MRIALRSRISIGSRPDASASRSICDSWAKHAWTTPKPRIAPHGRWFVRTAHPSTIAFGHRYGPWVWVTALRSTADDVDAYAPPSNTIAGLDLDDLSADRSRDAASRWSPGVGGRGRGSSRRACSASVPGDRGAEREQAACAPGGRCPRGHRTHHPRRRAPAGPARPAGRDTRRSGPGPRAATGWRRAVRRRRRRSRGSPARPRGRGRPGPASRSRRCPRRPRLPSASGSPCTIRWWRSTLPCGWIGAAAPSITSSGSSSGLEHLVLDDDRLERPPAGLGMVRCHCGDRLADVAHDVAREHRLVVVDQPVRASTRVRRRR